MAVLIDLPAELRQGILEYVLYSSVVPAERPNVDDTNPLDWCIREPIYQSAAPAYLHREQHAMAQLVPYMLVSKAFYEDVQCLTCFTSVRRVQACAAPHQLCAPLPS
jgi:hypothetical protein